MVSETFFECSHSPTSITAAACDHKLRMYMYVCTKHQYIRFLSIQSLEAVRVEVIRVVAGQCVLSSYWVYWRQTCTILDCWLLPTAAVEPGHAPAEDDEMIINFSTSRRGSDSLAACFDLWKYRYRSVLDYDSCYLSLSKCQPPVLVQIDINECCILNG